LRNKSIQQTILFNDDISKELFILVNLSPVFIERLCSSSRTNTNLRSFKQSVTL